LSVHLKTDVYKGIQLYNKIYRHFLRKKKQVCFVRTLRLFNSKENFYLMLWSNAKIINILLFSYNRMLDSLKA
jgi:uncharacterized membrane protein